MHLLASLGAQMVKSRPAVQETWVGKMPWRRKWQPTPVFLPGESHGRRSLGYTVHGVTKTQTQLTLSASNAHTFISQGQ